VNAHTQKISKNEEFGATARLRVEIKLKLADYIPVINFVRLKLSTLN